MTNNDDYYINDSYHPMYNYTTEDYLDDPNLEPPPFSYPFQFRIVCYILYNFIFTFGLIGNLLVFYTIHYTHPNMKTVQNYFLANLACGDLLIVILCVPTGYISVLWQYWPFGSIACFVLTPMKAVGVFVSSYTLVALAIDRYLAILYPLKMGLSKQQCRWIIGIIWVSAVITAVPVAVNSRIEVHLGSGEERCGEYGWESFTQELTYSLVLLFLQYLFPVCVLIYTYTRISFVVWGKRCQPTMTRRGSGQRSWAGGVRSAVIQQPSKGKRKTVILSLSVVCGYTLAWLPYNIVYMIYKHGPEYIMDAEFFPYLFIICHLISMGHSIYNVIIYTVINSRFRRSFAMVVKAKCPCCVCLMGKNEYNFRGRGSSSVCGTERRRVESLADNNRASSVEKDVKLKNVKVGTHSVGVPL